mmetsp:Transcript_1876/g.2721  ORF Transcript_1876/g.2721 Transcript_1876/m.2721 type:complete len:582 (+) Transcript_1876:600-2345(+)
MEYLPQHRILEDPGGGAGLSQLSSTPQASYYNEDGNDTNDSNVRNILVQIFSNLLLFFLIFGMSATVDFRRIKQQLRNCYAISAGVTMQFIIMPALGFMAVVLLKKHGLTTPMGITLLLVTSSPGGSYSNWWCSLFNADLALSVAMTALSTLISIAALPANLVLYSHLAYGLDAEQEKSVLSSVDFRKLIISLAIVISAILCGLFASYKIESTKFRRSANTGGTVAGITLIIVSAVFSTTGTSDVKPWNQHWSFYVGVATPCVAGLFLSNIIAKCAKLTKPEVVTLSVECSYQNTGIATSAVLAMFDSPQDVAQAMAVPLFYGVVEMVVLGLYCLIAWKMGWTKAPSEEKLCIVISKTYEVVSGGEDNMDDATALQSSVDSSTKVDEHGLECGRGRDRVDTMLSEDTFAASVSDISTGGDFNNNSSRAARGTGVRTGLGMGLGFGGAAAAAAGGTGSDHPSSIHCEAGLCSGQGNTTAIQHVRSLPPRLDPNSIAVQKVFHTIQEDSECFVEVSEHHVRDMDVSGRSYNHNTSGGGAGAGAAGVGHEQDAPIVQFMSFKGKDYEDTCNSTEMENVGDEDYR